MIYNRNKAIEYAHKWSHGRNPVYYDFDNIGSDCTNFISQCLERVFMNKKGILKLTE